jgi:hypothetical protein
MKKYQQSKKKTEGNGSWRFFILVIAVFLVTSGVSYLYFKPRFSFEAPLISGMNGGKEHVSEDTGDEEPLDLYRNGSPAFYEEEFREDTILVIAEDVITKYIKEYKIRLLDLYMDRSGVIYIDLSDGLRKNFSGDVLEEFNIVAGLYSRIKTTVPGFTALKILIEGKEVDSFGGHIDISRPIGEGIAAGIR